MMAQRGMLEIPQSTYNLLPAGATTTTKDSFKALCKYFKDQMPKKRNHGQFPVAHVNNNKRSKEKRDTMKISPKKQTTNKHQKLFNPAVPPISPPKYVKTPPQRPQNPVVPPAPIHLGRCLAKIPNLTNTCFVNSCLQPLRDTGVSFRILQPHVRPSPMTDALATVLEQMEPNVLVPYNSINQLYIRCNRVKLTA